MFQSALRASWDDNVPRLGASVAYYTLFAIAPVLLVAIAIAGLAFGAEAVRGEIVGQIDQLSAVRAPRQCRAFSKARVNDARGISRRLSGASH
jgi:membrane protein